MTKRELQKIQDRWHAEVYDKAEAVDPHDDYTWDGLLLGFLLGAGVPLQQADDIVVGAPTNGWKL